MQTAECVTDKFGLQLICFGPLQAANRYNIDRTAYFRCLHGELKISDLEAGQSLSDIQNLEHHCIDYSNGQPVFVRGTYLMVHLVLYLRMILCLTFKQSDGLL